MVLDHASVQVNTFPSGHASVTFAAALAVSTVSTELGLTFGVVAASITIATVLGRYHYAVDSIVGLLLGSIAWWIGFHLWCKQRRYNAATCGKGKDADEENLGEPPDRRRREWICRRRCR